MEGDYYAHSAVGGRREEVIVHLRETARFAKLFAEASNTFEVETAGLLHDIGKYGGLFQKRLRGEVSGVDHWSMGAWILLTQYGPLGVAAALAVQGHHLGLQSGFPSNLNRTLNPRELVKHHPQQLDLSEADPQVLKRRFREDGGTLPTPPREAECRFVADCRSNHDVAAMLDVRMVYSALVDADFIVTEAHFNRDERGSAVYRPKGRGLEPETGLRKLADHVSGVRAGSNADTAVRALRDDLFNACLEAAHRPVGLYTLSAPTGSGKTLAMLAFALRHAMENGLRRLIVVLPFLSLIEQTGQVYRSVFQEAENEETPYVLEDHSLADAAESSGGEDSRRKARLLAENWDAPLIVTTSVRFLESLFSNRPSDCRKLHNIARSVVLLDEVQTLPPHMAVPTLAALSHLREAFGCSIVLSTATQPAFECLSGLVQKHAPGGWRAVEIISEKLNLFDRVSRVRVHWPADEGETTSLEELAEELLSRPAVMAIVNVKRHSRGLYELMAAQGADGTYHLSTDMCPAHRTDVLDEVKARLKSGDPCRLACTQCVEAGVDIDFPVVYRAWAPLEALAQASGRCNREGRLPYGTFHVLALPAEEEQYPNQTYRMAAAQVKLMLRERGGQLDLQDPAVFAEYYRAFYRMADIGNTAKELHEYLRTLDFPEVARRYRLIEQNTINVLVPYEPRMREYMELSNMARKEGVTRRWIHRARPLSVSVYRAALGSPIGDWLEPVKRDKEDTGWYIYLNDRHYSSKVGLVGPVTQEFLVA